MYILATPYQRILKHLYNPPLKLSFLLILVSGCFLKKEEECLAACTGAPMMMVDHEFHEHLTAEKVDKILDDLK